MKRNFFSSPSPQRGVVLVEAMVAILLFAVGVLAVAGLQASMIKNSADSKYRAEASYIAQQMIGTMWSDPNNLIAYVGNNKPVPDLPNGSMNVNQFVVNGPYVISVSWTQPGQDTHVFTTVATIP